MGHIHSVYDTDAHFKINPITRKISAEGNSKVSLVQFDHNSERFTFEIPKLIEGHDMSSCNKVEVHFINVDKGKKKQSTGVYLVDDMQVSDENKDIVIFSWLISRAATLYEGSLNFIVKMICQTNEVIDYQWNTEIYSGISVSTGINNSDIILEDYIDVLEAWKATITEIPQDKIQTAVDNYLQQHPVTIEEQDPTVPEWAKAVSKPEYTASEVGARPDTWMPSAADVGALPATTKIPSKVSDMVEDATHRTVTDETQIAGLQEQLKQTQIESAVKVALLGAKATDIDYMTFKLKEKGELELAEDGSIKGIDDKVSALKTQFPNQFESASGKEGRVFEVNKLPNNNNSGGVTKEAFEKMGYQDRLKLYNESPETYAELSKN